MKKKLILGLFVCVLSLTLSLNISVKANASTSELSISPILVSVEKVFSYNNEMTINIPKEILLNNSGVISLSLTTFYIDDSGQFNSSNYDGSVIYLKYKVEDEQINFLKK